MTRARRQAWLTAVVWSLVVVLGGVVWALAIVGALTLLGR